MKQLRIASALLLIVMFSAAVGADVWVERSYEQQFREHANEAPGKTFLLGTDELGRDRFSRLVYGARVSLLLAPTAAILCVAVSALLGVTAGFFGGLWNQAAAILTDLFLCLPWIFVLLTVRAVLPLNVESSVSIAITFLLLGLLAWAPGARMLRSGTQALINDDFALQGRASGLRTSRLIGVHLLPQLRPLLVSQFWMLLPAFLLTEANLGMLGLGVTEPMPSLGNLLGELSNVHRVTAAPWILAPAVFLVLVLICLNLMLPAIATNISSREGTHL